MADHVPPIELGKALCAWATAGTRSCGVSGFGLCEQHVSREMSNEPVPYWKVDPKSRISLSLKRQAAEVRHMQASR